MRRLMLALPFALLPSLALAAEHDHSHHHHDHDGHASLGAHEHGAAELDAALDGSKLEIELRSPAMNLVGFEHAPSSDEDKRKIADARQKLETPDALFGLPAAAGCTLAKAELESPLFGDAPAAHGHGHDHAEHKHGHDHDHDHGDHVHSDINAHYAYDCASPQALQALDLQALFKTFPGTEKIQAQLIGPNGQRGTQLNAGQPRAEF
jgi:hypothetical protein